VSIRSDDPSPMAMLFPPMLGQVTFALVAGTLLAIFWAGLVDAAALSTQVPSQRESCFYTWVDQQYEKVGFYFAVQEGGNFDIDYTVISPSNRIILEGFKSSQEDFVFTGNEMGEYRFCFHNNHSSHADKLVCSLANIRSTLTSPSSLSPAWSCHLRRRSSFVSNLRPWKTPCLTSTRTLRPLSAL